MRYRCGAFFSRTLSVAFITAVGTTCGLNLAMAQVSKPTTASAPALAAKPTATASAPAPKVQLPAKPAVGAPVASVRSASAPAAPVTASKVAAKPVAAPASAAAAVSAASVASSPAAALKPKAPPSKAAVLDERAQALKRELQKLNQELQALEQAVMYPPSGQVAVFVSLGAVKDFVPESVELKLGDKVVAQHTYSAAEQAALKRGGVQRLYVGAVKAGEQELVASFAGKASQDRTVKRTATVKFEKGADPKYVQLRIEDAGTPSQPDVAVKVGP